jgi:hypothetical protein
MFAAIYLVCFGIEKPPGTFLVASGLADAAFIAGKVAASQPLRTYQK